MKGSIILDPACHKLNNIRLLKKYKKELEESKKENSDSNQGQLNPQVEKHYKKTITTLEKQLELKEKELDRINRIHRMYRIEFDQRSC